MNPNLPQCSQLGVRLSPTIRRGGERGGTGLHGRGDCTLVNSSDAPSAACSFISPRASIGASRPSRASACSTRLRHSSTHLTIASIAEPPRRSAPRDRNIPAWRKGAVECDAKLSISGHNRLAIGPWAALSLHYQRARKRRDSARRDGARPGRARYSRQAARRVRHGLCRASLGTAGRRR